MKKYLLILLLISANLYAFPIPKDGKASFDIIRKNKIIGSHEIFFDQIDDELFVKTKINIRVNILFFPAYRFSHLSTETWSNNEFVKFVGHTDFEDEREYFIKGEDIDNSFIAEGMDGEIRLDKSILPSNLWNQDILLEKELFDIQKGVKRKITVKKLGEEEIGINNLRLNTLKFTFDASDNPKDKGPFPEYTLWYDEKKELIKFQFINYKDKKVVTGIRNDLENN
jgi:hypothetical protein